MKIMLANQADEGPVEAAKKDDEEKVRAHCSVASSLSLGFHAKNEAPQGAGIMSQAVFAECAIRDMCRCHLIVGR